MSTTGKDPSSALIAGVKTVLEDNVTISSVTYPVYDTFYKGATNRSYVYIGNYLDDEDGSKDSFVYHGTLAIESVDESGVQNVARTTAQSICNKVRSLLKTTKGGTFTVTGFTLTVFSHAGSTQIREKTDDGRERIRIIDIYEFIIE